MSIRLVDCRGVRVWAFAAGATLTALTAGCGDSSKGTEECQPEVVNACGDGLTCTPQADGKAKCQIPPGSACDPGAKDPNCQVGSVCADRPADATALAEHVCLVTKAGTCDPVTDFCAADLTCAELEGGSFQCHPPLLVRGKVQDAADDTVVEGAHVISLDAQSVAVTDVAVTKQDGSYQLEIPVVRNADGTPRTTSFTLRGAAQSYQTFPGGLRTAIPFSTSDAVQGAEGFVLENSLTDLSLIHLPDDGVSRHRVSGQLHDAAGSETAETLAKLSGVLMVAEGGEIRTSITDKRGAFTIFNLPDGTFELGGYAAGVEVTRAPVSLAGADKTGLELEAKLGTLSKVSGSVQLVNPGDGKATSVILVVESTFDATFARGDTPRGLRTPQSGAPDVTGAFSIGGVPDGRYVVLAAFENDALVRDPDTNISGTDIVHITVKGGDVQLAESFKITGALAIMSPGADQPEAMSGAPMLRWADDSSEDWYEVRVYDAFGKEVWSDLHVVGQSGTSEISVKYAGPMDSGMYYQFRVTSWRMPGGKAPAPIAATEDLRGVFFVAN